MAEDAAAAGPLPPPEGVEPMMISMKNMSERYDLKTGPNIKDVVPYKLFPVAQIMEEIQKIGFYSDFFNYKTQLAKLPEDGEILVIADPDEKYGQNFLCCVTQAAKERELKLIQEKVAAEQAAAEAARKAAEEAAAKKKAEEDAIANAVYVEKPIVARPWESETQHDTLAEISASNVHPGRKRIRVRLSRKRREFGGVCKFNDRDAEQIKQQCGLMEFRQHKDPNFELKRRTMSIGLQDCPSWTESWLSISKVSQATQGSQSEGESKATASPRGSALGHELPPASSAVHEGVPRMVSISSQTLFFPTQNNSSQCTSSGAGDDEDKKDLTTSISLSAFLKASSRAMEEVLQQNETLDIFKGDFSSLAEEEGMSFGTRSENTLPELRNFTDLTYSKNKILKAIDWHPRSKKVVAVSCTENFSFEERVQLSGRAKPAFVLIWNFQDLIHPQLVLESPFEIECFRFNPTAPHLIAGGTITGQVVLWDISDSMEKLRELAKGPSASHRRKAADDSDYMSEEDKSIPPIRPTFVSTIDNSHKRPVTQLVWMPDGMQVSHRGALSASEGGGTEQFVTIAGDGQFLVWDLRFQEIARKKQQRSDKRISGDAEIDWNPHFKCTLHKMDGVGELGLRRVSIRGKDSGSEFVATTEEGEIVEADWCGVTAAAGGGEEDSGDKKDRIVRSIHQDHFRPSIALQQSPFFDDIYLSVGDWSFNLWCRGLASPVFASPFSEAYLTAGLWSPTRPGVIILSRADGAIEIWDLTDQSHKASMAAPVAPVSITSMEFALLSASQSSQMLAAGDGSGNLHILEMPRQMCRAGTNEKAVMRSFFDREVRRVQYVTQRHQQRENGAELEEDNVQADDPQEHEVDARAKRKAEAEERKLLEAQLKKEEDEYRKLEARYREELGVEEEEDAEEDMDSAYADPNADAPQKELTPRGETEVEAEGVNVEIQGETKL